MDGRNKILKNKVFLTFNFGLGPPEGGLLEGMGEVLETPVGVLEEGLCRTPGQGARLQTRALFEVCVRHTPRAGFGQFCSVADPGCLSRIPTIICSRNYNKIANFIFEQVNNFFSQITKSYSTFYTNICH